MKSLQAGFTIVELMIVVLIIAVLAAVAIPLYQQMTLKNIAVEAEVNIQYLMAEEAAFFQVYDRYGSFEDLGLVWTSASKPTWNRYARGGGSQSSGGGGGWVSNGNGGTGSDGSSSSSATPADSGYFVYTITLDAAKTNCTVIANYANGKASILASTVANRGTVIGPLSVLINLF